MSSKCTYCHRPADDDSKYSYGVPGHKYVVKCNRWWCTLKQKCSRQLKQLIFKVCSYVIDKVKHG